MSERPIEHRSKKGHYHAGRVWRLHDGVLSCDAGGSHREIPVDNIEALHLTYAPTRFEFNCYTCFVKPKRRSFEKIYSVWDAGLAKAEDHSATYSALIRTLIAEVHDANPSARFRIGEPGPRYWVELAFLVVIFVCLAAALSIVGLSWSWGTATIAIIALVSLPLGFLWARRNRPRAFDPQQPPSEMLPAIPKPGPRRR